jgi:hypothetical protein
LIKRGLGRLIFKYCAWMNLLPPGTFQELLLLYPPAFENLMNLINVPVLLHTYVLKCLYNDMSTNNKHPMLNWIG